MNSIKLEDPEKFWELWRNHSAKMSVHFNVHMSKIMPTLIKVGVGTYATIISINVSLYYWSLKQISKHRKFFSKYMKNWEMASFYYSQPSLL